MDPTQIGLFALAERRLAWDDQRQTLLAKNIANMATPSYQPQDLQPFAQTLSRFSLAEPVQTQPNHMMGSLGTGAGAVVTDPPAVRQPDGNAVSLDEQLTKVANTGTQQSLVTAIYKKYLGLFSLALGRSGQG
jgi:flagellar basal-body rod protein FlgB